MSDHDDLEARVAAGMTWLTEHDPTGAFHFWFKAGLTKSSPMPAQAPERREDWIDYYEQRVLWERLYAECERLDAAERKAS